MKKALSLLLALLLAFVCAASALAGSVYASYKIPHGAMRMIAHRGYSSAAPENTLAAYRAAGESDFWGAECDIHRTADGAWVLMHDDTVDRMTNGEGRVSDLTLAELRALTIDAGKNVAQYPDEKIPTLTEYLDVCAAYGLHPVIEIKANADPATMDELAALLCARPEKDAFVIISFGREICARIKGLMPETPVYYLSDNRASREDLDFAVKNGLDGLDLHHGVTDDYVKAAQKAGLDVIVWTVDDVPTAERFYKLGVTAVTTNALTQQKPQGTLLQKLVWALRDVFYLFTKPARDLIAAFSRKC